MSSAREQEYLVTLDEKFNVQDVYFHKGKLHVINGYDLLIVEKFVHELPYPIEIVTDEDYL